METNQRKDVVSFEQNQERFIDKLYKYDCFIIMIVFVICFDILMLALSLCVSFLASSFASLRFLYIHDIDFPIHSFRNY